MDFTNVDVLKYLNLGADVIKSLFLQWDVIENVAIRFIDFIERLSTSILNKY